MNRTYPTRSTIVARSVLCTLAFALAAPSLAQQAPPAQTPQAPTPPAQTPAAKPTAPPIEAAPAKPTTPPQRQGAVAKGQAESGTLSTKARDELQAAKQAADNQVREVKASAAAISAQQTKGAQPQVDPNLTMSPTLPQGAHAAAAPAVQVQPSTTPAIRFEPAILDLGEMIAEVAKTGTIKIVNITDAPVMVTKIVPGCGCTTTGAPPGEIAPGASANVDITLKPGAKAGVQLTKSVTFQIDGHAPQILTVRGDVKAFIAISADILEGPSSPDAPPTSVMLTSVEGVPFTVTGMLPDVLVELPKGAAKEHEIKIDWKKWEQQGSGVKLSVMTDHPKAPQLTILVKRSIKPGINPAPPALANETVSPLVLAARSGDATALKAALVASSGKTDETERMSKRTALHFAAESGNVEIVGILLAAKANPNAPDKNGKTPVTIAAEKGRADVLKALLAAGGDVNARDQVQGSPLLWAAGLGTPETVRVLLDANADPNISDVNGMTPLMWAAGVGRPEVVEVLMAKGADLKAIDRITGETALMRAIRTGKADNVKLLLAKGGDLNTKNALGMTPFLVACGYGDMDKIKLLIDAGADKTAKDARGWGAIDHARNRVDPSRDVVVKFIEPMVPASTATVQPPAGSSGSSGAPTTPTGAPKSH